VVISVNGVRIGQVKIKAFMDCVFAPYGNRRSFKKGMLAPDERMVREGGRAICPHGSKLHLRGVETSDKVIQDMKGFRAKEMGCITGE
jgi:hypothetical protein